MPRPGGHSPARRAGAWALVAGLLAGPSLAPLCAFAADGISPAPVAASPAYRPDRILIQPREGIDAAAVAGLHAAQHSEVLATFPGIRGLQVVRVPEGDTVPSVIARYQQSGLVEFAEPDCLGRVLASAPDDPRYQDHTLWGLDRIEAPAGWEILNSASNVVVAVVDTGVRYTHEDLAANMWVNPEDGGHGWNALTGTNDPNDDGGSGHGTMVAGVLGAVGNNGRGVTGVAWRVRILAGKAFNQFGVGSLSTCITCLDYARVHGAQILNASWGFDTNSLALSNAVASARDAGLIVVAAAGNRTNDLDLNPVFPACYPLDNIVAVTASTRTDGLAADANYGATQVDLAAPGHQIHSTFGATDTFYYTLSGSSFAAPHVSGALALLTARYPAETYRQRIVRLLHGVDPVPALAGKCATGGRLNLRNALSPPIRLTSLPASPGGGFGLRVSSGANRTCVIEVSPDLTNWSPIATNATSAEGSFDFVEPRPADPGCRFYRATAAP